jgi:hypothetical protein
MIPECRDDSFEFGQPQPDACTVTFLSDDLFLVAPRGGIPALGAGTVRPNDRHARIDAPLHPGRRGSARSGQQDAIKQNHAYSLTGRGFRKVAPWFILEASASQLRGRRQSSGFNFRRRAIGSSDASSAVRSSSVVRIRSSLGVVQGLRLFGESSSTGRFMSHSRSRRAHDVNFIRRFNNYAPIRIG